MSRFNLALNFYQEAGFPEWKARQKASRHAAKPRSIPALEYPRLDRGLERQRLDLASAFERQVDIENITPRRLKRRVARAVRRRRLAKLEELGRFFRVEP